MWVESGAHSVIAFVVQTGVVDVEVRCRNHGDFSGVLFHARFFRQSVDRY